MEAAMTLPSSADDRAAAMYEAYSDGATLQEVGDRFAISRERVRQIFREYGWNVRSVKQAAALRRDSEHALAPKIVEFHTRLKDPRQVAEQLGVSQVTVRDVLKAAELVNPRPASSRRRKYGATQKRYSDEELLDCLKKASRALGGVLTTAAYAEFIQGRSLSGGRLWPSHQALQLRFGSWREALERAGLRANASSPIAGQRIFEAAHCVDAIRLVAREVRRAPTAAEYDDAARASGGALPSLATVRNRCGGWLDALRAAGL